MSTPTLIRSFAALSAVVGHLIVKAGVGGVATAGAATDLSIGFSTSLGSAEGEMLDVVLGGVGEVRAGGTFAFGDRLTSDAQGRAIKAVPVAGSVIAIAGVAMADAVVGDIVPALAAPSLLATPA